jgi:transposase
VPLSIKAAATLVDEAVELTPSVIKGYSLKESISEYVGIEQRWILVESQQRSNSDLKQLAKKIEQCQQKSQQEFQSLSVREFACATDARIAALGMIMALCLLVYNLGQRQLRQALAQSDATIPNQLGKPTATPTLRWVFQ